MKINIIYFNYRNIMENKIRIKNGKKQVKKGKTWRPCCLIEGCINRTNKEICKYHNKSSKIINNDPTKRKKNKRTLNWLELLTDKLLNIAIIHKIIIKVDEEDKEYDIDELEVLKREDKCRFKCLKCNEIYKRDIRSIVEKDLICTRNCNIKIKKKYVINNIKNEIKWENNLEKLKKFIDKNKRTPIESSKNDEEKKLGQWLSGQKIGYKRYINNDNRNKMPKYRIPLWNKFINNNKYKDYLLTYDEKWLNYLKELKNFIDNNNRLPNKNKEEEKLHNWLYCNKYKNNNMTPDRTIKWEEFINDDKYKEYLINLDEKWLDNIKIIKECFNNNKKLSSGLYKFIYHQKEYYKNYKFNLNKNNNLSTDDNNNLGTDDNNNLGTDDNIYLCIMNEDRVLIWEDFINDDKYKKNLMTLDKKWSNNIKELKVFIDKNGRLPKRYIKEEKKLARFNAYQNECYKYGKMLKYRIPIWEEFINHDKYKEYLITNDKIWTNNIKELKLFIDKNGRLPSIYNKNEIEKYLGKWFSHQKGKYSNYKNKHKYNIMPEDRIPIWEEFINDDKYKEILLRHSTRYCESEACSLYDYSEKTIARYQINDGRYFCRNCCQHLFPNLIPKLFVRQEHLILAEIQRKIEDNFDNIISLIWDCPINCTLKRPDLLYELDDIYVWFENDESGHEHTHDRLHEITNSLYNKNKKPIILFRINPNLKKRELLKQDKNKEWKSTKHFDKAFEDFINIIKEQLDIFKEYYENDEYDEYDEDYNYKDDDKLYFHEVGFLFNKKDVPKDRGEYIYDKNKYIFYKKLSNTI